MELRELREMREWFDRHEQSDLHEFGRLHDRLDKLDEAAEKILVEARRTNGRVSKLEVTQEVDSRVEAAVGRINDRAARRRSALLNTALAGLFVVAGGGVGWLLHILTGVG